MKQFESASDIIAYVIMNGDPIKNEKGKTKYHLLTYTSGLTDEESEAIKECVAKTFAFGIIEEAVINKNGEISDSFRNELQWSRVTENGKTVIAYNAKTSKKPVLLVFANTDWDYIKTQENSEQDKRISGANLYRAKLGYTGETPSQPRFQRSQLHTNGVHA